MFNFSGSVDDLPKGSIKPRFPNVNRFEDSRKAISNSSGCLPRRWDRPSTALRKDPCDPENFGVYLVCLPWRQVDVPSTTQPAIAVVGTPVDAFLVAAPLHATVPLIVRTVVQLGCKDDWPDRPCCRDFAARLIADAERRVATVVATVAVTAVAMGVVAPAVA